MRMDKLTTSFQTALADAQSLAIGHDNAFIEPVHLMQALLSQENGTAYHIFTKANVNLAVLQDGLNSALDQLPQVEGTGGEIHISNDLNKLLNITDKLAQKRNDHFISSELFILAALEDKGPLGQALKKSRRSKTAYRTGHQRY